MIDSALTKQQGQHLISTYVLGKDLSALYVLTPLIVKELLLFSPFYRRENRVTEGWSGLPRDCVPKHLVSLNFGCTIGTTWRAYSELTQLNHNL